MASDEKFISIQIGPISFVDEGVERVLDNLEKLAKVNVLMVGTNGYDTAVNLPSEGYADHGQAPRNIEGLEMTGNWAKVHPEYYGGTMLKDFRVREPEFRDVDALDMVMDPAHKRGMQVYSWLRENPNRLEVLQIPNFPKVLEIDIYGRRIAEPCVNNPDYRNWWLSQIEDQMKSYPLDGFLFNVERRGPLGEALTRLWSGRGLGYVPTCFCEHCRAIGRERGINVERARDGMEKVWDYVQAAIRGDKFVDGSFVTFLRLLLRYPEVLAWNQVWADGMDSLRAEMYGVVKAINPAKKIGWHIYHEGMFSPFFRAETDYAKMAQWSDYIKPVIYPVCAGVRFARFVHRLNQTVLRDATPEQTMRLLYAVMNWDEGSLEDLPKAGFTAESVYKETKRVVEDVKDTVPVYPGIDLGIPTGGEGRYATTEDVEQATLAAYRGGAKGLVISRVYHEMELPVLAGVGKALDQLGIK